MALSDSNFLVTLSDAKVWLKVSTDENDDVIEELIKAASEAANRITNRLIKTRTLTEYYRGDNTPHLWTRNYPIGSITTIHLDSDRTYAAASLVSAGSIIFNSESGKITLENDSFPNAPAAVKLVYVAGYVIDPDAAVATPFIPADLLMAVKNLILYWWKQWSSGRIGRVSESIQGGTTEYTQEVPKEIMTALFSHRRVPIRGGI